MKLFLLAAVVAIAPASPQLDGSFTVRSTERDDRINLNLQYDGNSNYGRTLERSALSDVSRNGDRISFTIRREPGTFKFEGRGSLDRASGWYDFEPNPNFDYKNAKSMLKFFGKTAGAMWIDEKDKQVARLEAVLFDSFNVGGGVLAKLKKGASFTLEQERVNDEIWLPSTADINLSVRVLLVKGIDLNQVIRSYDYRKFSTEVKDAKVDPLKQD